LAGCWHTRKVRLSAEYSKQFLGQQASGSGRKARLYHQRHAAERKQQQPWCEMAVVPPMNSRRDFLTLSSHEVLDGQQIGLSSACCYITTLFLQSFPFGKSNVNPACLELLIAGATKLLSAFTVL